MGLFDKKTCDFCGGKIGMLGNRKLADGNMCKGCAQAISPVLTGRKQFSVADMKDHLAYREENKKAIEVFNPTSTFGTNTKVYIDENTGKWLVSGASNFRNANPDVLDVSQVTGCNSQVKETKTELKYTKPDGKRESYNPPRYDIDYDFYITINVNSPWFSEIEFKVNSKRIDTRNSAEYRSAEETTDSIKKGLTQVQSVVREQAKPKTSIQCHNCQATTIPDENGRCEYCGGATS